MLKRAPARSMVVLALIVAAACGKDDEEGGGATPPTAFAEVPIGGPASKTIGPAGGTITSADGHLSIEIPPGALTTNSKLEIQQIEIPTAWGWSLRPHGTKFAVPAKVTATFSGAEVGTPSRNTVAGIVKLELPMMGATHLVNQPGSAGEGLDLTATWDEPNPTMRYEGSIQSFSALLLQPLGLVVFAGAVSASASEAFIATATQPMASRPSSIGGAATSCEKVNQNANTAETVQAKSRLDGVEFNSKMLEMGQKKAIETQKESGFEQSMTCSSLGAGSLMASIGFLYESESVPPGCTMIQPGRVTVTREIECTGTDAGTDAGVDSGDTGGTGGSGGADANDDASDAPGGDAGACDGGVVKGASKGQPCGPCVQCTAPGTGLFCVDGVCCDQACYGECQACTAAKKGGGVDGVCGPIAAGTDPDKECSGLPLWDSTGLSRCYNNGCQIPLGTPCTLPLHHCTSGPPNWAANCVDGVCCNNQCTLGCTSCLAVDTGGADGTCAPVLKGTDPANECSAPKPNCAGAAGLCE